MKWNLFSNKLPEIGMDVLVCFDPSNPFSCEVCSLEVDDEGDYVWWTIDRNYPTDDKDYWAEIEMPHPSIPAYQEEED